MKRLFNRSSILVIVLSITVNALVYAAFSPPKQAVQNEQPVIQPVMVQTVMIVDDALIADMLVSSLIPENPATVDSIQVIDATSNGFGENDMIILHPQQISYTFNAQGQVRELMKNWKTQTGRQLD